MQITNETIELTLEELENELDSGSDLAKEIISSMTTSFRPSFLDAGAEGQANLFLTDSEEIQAMLDARRKRLAHARRS